MKSLLAILKHPDELYPLVKLKLAVTIAEKKIPPEPHWAFCYSMLYKVFTGSAFVFQKLDPQLRDPVCILYLILRALDTVEDDTSITTETKLPILMNFHRHIYDPHWHFSCGTDADHKILIDEFHHISTAFLGLEIGYQELIEDMTMRMGAGMAKYVGKGQIETIDGYNEYCHYAGGIVATGLSKMFYVSGKEDMPPDVLSNSFGVFMQKADVIKDYVEDINEMPMPRMFWPREIWSKYADKLEDFKYEENSVRAVQCLNEMVTDALTHVQDCLAYMSALRDPSTFFLCAVLQIVEFATLALCYNNIEVFRGNLKVRRGLIAKVIDQTKTVADVYRAFYEFSCMIKLKVDESDPNASKTKDNLEVILKICRDSGNLNNKKYSKIIQSKHQSIVNVHTCSHRARNPGFGTRKSRATLCINWPRKSPFTISNSHSQLLNGELCGTNLCKSQVANLINI